MLSQSLTLISKTVTKMNQVQQLAVYYITAGSVDEGQKIANGLVEGKLAACVNMVEEVQSTYLWQGAINTDKQVLLIVKSRLGLLAKIQAKVKQLHSYEVPQLIALPIVGGSQSYTKWVFQSTLQE